MFIKKDLDFLVGYPGLDGSWISQPEGKEPGIITITRNHIHKATFTINKLLRDFPKALPKIVGDVDKWSAQHKDLLKILKTSIHNDKPFPKSLAHINPEFGDGDKKLYYKLLRDYPSLSHVLDSFSWITHLKPETFKEALSWLDNNAIYIDKIYRNLGTLDGIKIIIKLWRLSIEVGERRIKSIILWVSDSRIYEFIMEQGYQYAYLVDASLSRKKSDSIPKSPKANFGDHIMKWIDWLSMQDDQTVKRSIELFDLVCDRSLIDNWENWWKQLNSAINEAEKIPRPLTRVNPLNRKLNNLREKIKKIEENTPPVLKSKLLFSLIKKWSEKDKSTDFKQIYKALGVLPIEYNSIPLRLAFWIYWDHLIEENSISKHKIIRNIIDEFSKYIKWHSDFSKAINLWKEVLDRWGIRGDLDRYIYTIDDDILDEIKDKKDISLIFDLLRELYKDRKFDDFKENEKRNLILLVNSVNKEYVLDSFFELRKHGMSCEYISEDMLKLAAEPS